METKSFDEFDQNSGSDVDQSSAYFRESLRKNFCNFVLNDEMEFASRSNSKKSLVKSLLSESMEGYHS
jgi:hypothetical protein